MNILVELACRYARAPKVRQEAITPDIVGSGMSLRRNKMKEASSAEL
ncbi:MULTISPECIES: hypothetical protein [Pseudomonas]|nr:hypothetical protein [Pseudomonas sp. BF-R-19]